MTNIMGLMKQAKDLQAKMQEMQDQLEEMTVDGVAGGGAVQVTLNGKGALRSVKIDPTLLQPDEAEIVEDLIVAAHGDAKSKLETATAEKMKALTGGLPLPPGFNLGL
ncbi:Nucleoid-associated protein YaaK [hydrothermal vent metagenome]|uniref:Nucleoid-associated protein YaaK n=1 Tax=hydrothermal vent metagenome TaxID=652676 RepID=A0A3B0T873_9ZZZZ